MADQQFFGECIDDLVCQYVCALHFLEGVENGKNFRSCCTCTSTVLQSSQAIFDKGIYDFPLLVFGHFYRIFFITLYNYVSSWAASTCMSSGV